MEAKKISLIAGDYSPVQVQEVVAKLIKHELQFHRLQNFTSLIRFGSNCNQATANIQHLCRGQEEIDRLLEVAEAEGLHLHIEAELRLSLVEAPVEEQAAVACPSL